MFLIFVYHLQRIAMRDLLYPLIILTVLSCTSAQRESADNQDVKRIEISAEKAGWAIESRASDDRAFAKDIPWAEGDKVMLIESGQTIDGSTTLYQHADGSWSRAPIFTLCTVSKAAGLKCTLVPDAPLAEGSYRAVYPVYDYVWYDSIHLSFLYEDWHELDFRHQDIVVSDPVEYREGHKLSFVLKHICALIDIDIYPPKTGNYSYLKLFAQSPVFAGKADYSLDEDYNIDSIASGWLNFTTLRGEGRSLKEGEVFPTSTGLLPVQFGGIPVRVHLIYDDGTHFVSEPIEMPSLRFGVASTLSVKNFTQTTEPMLGLWGDYYDDPSPTPYPVN